jgi:hypothetical protein
MNINLDPAAGTLELTAPETTAPLSFAGEIARVVCRDTTISASSLKYNEKLGGLESASAENGIRLRFRTEKEPAHNAARIFLEIENPGQVQVNSVQFCDFPLSGTVETFPGLGQPVYCGSQYFGIEYPAANCTARGENLLLERYYGTTATLVQCEPVVIGQRLPGMSIEDSFLEYVLARKQHPQRSFALYNSWYDLRDFNEQQALHSWHGWLSAFIQKRNAKLDSFVLDDGWDNYNSLWDKARDRFPEGFANLKREIEAGGSHLGIWVSPWGGYGKPAAKRRAFGKAHGFEILSTGKGFCLAAPRYKRRFIQLCTDFMDKDGVNYFKFDGFPSRCSDPSHGHPIGDKFEQSAFVDAFNDILHELKKKNPDVFLNLTTGVWLSPWWLEHGDAVWRGENDYGKEGSGAPVEQSENYVDGVIYRALREKKQQFPVAYLMTHGIIKGRVDVIGHTSETLHQWKDRVATNIGRGLLMQEMYFSPELISDDKWDFLVQMLTWWRKNSALLERTHLVFGNPQKEEAYGYIHWSNDGKLALLLRNPSDRRQEVSLTAKNLRLNENIKLPRAWRIVYCSNQNRDSIIRPINGTQCALDSREVLLMESKD